MNNHHPDIEFRPLVIPASADDVDAADFREMTRVRNLVYQEIYGNADETLTPAELLPRYKSDPDQTRVVWLAVWEGTVVGRIGLDIPHEEGSRAAYFLIELLAEFHGRGIGTAAYELIERTAREHGRTSLQSWNMHEQSADPDDTPRIAAPTGFGTIPSDRAARFYLNNGFTLEQIERKSELDLRTSQETVDRLFAAAEEASVGYRVVQWMLPTPPERAEQYAWMKSRMSTDAPSAGLDQDEEVWDAERIARHDARYIDANQIVLVTAAEHVESGRLVGLNELAIGEVRTVATWQEDTIVLVEHRGHKLGLLVKCAGLIAWRDIAPDSPKVVTYNAEENRPMLDINEAIGFAPVGYEGAWQKVLT